MRPPGQVRIALGDAAQELHVERGGATWREIADRAQVGYVAARDTVRTMERAGVLQGVGYEKRAHSARWMKLYAPGENAHSGTWATQTTGAALAGVMRLWPVAV